MRKSTTLRKASEDRKRLLQFEVATAIFVFRKPLARLVVPKSLSEEADKKTPFAIIRLRSANCNRKQKEDIQDGTE